VEKLIFGPEIKYIVGVDEVGRGPLAGPITFCALKLPIDFVAKGFGRKIKDSKLLPPKKRKEIFQKIEKLKKKNIIKYALHSCSNEEIDTIGLGKVVKICIANALEKLKLNPEESYVLLDGGIKAPKEYKNQKTIIGGDAKVRAISFASIVAKIWRDNKMISLSKRYPKYQFHKHKGYATDLHCDLIREHGLSSLHRKSFCKNIVKVDIH
jgi:ribonuclease HII